MAESFQTWRELLSSAIRDPQERQRIAEILKVNPITLTRWVSCKSNPRLDTLRLLIDALPQYAQQLKNFIAEEYPHIFIDAALANSHVPPIPSTFYTHVLNIHTTNQPQLRSTSICIATLQQMLGHLDPRQHGMAIFVACCMPPVSGQRVRSLRMILGRATEPWNSHLDNWNRFLGAESQAGCAAMSGHPLIIQSYEDKLRLFPTHSAPEVQSSVAWPILLADHVAGSLCLFSTQSHYFQQAHLEIIQQYADLLVLAFWPNEFYGLDSIKLGIMPPHTIQRQYVADFQQHVRYYMTKALYDGKPISRDRAELLAWQEMETTLLQVVLDLNAQEEYDIQHKVITIKQ